MATDLIADIGGTNLRFALVEDGRIVRDEVLSWPGIPSISRPALQFLRGVQPERAVFAVATAVTGSDELYLPNVLGPDAQGSTFSLRQIKTELGLRQFEVLNDFTAIALAIPLLGKDDAIAVGATPTPVAHAPIGVIGAGTGLGVSGLLWGGQDYLAFHSEGGHVTLPATNGREEQVISLLREKFGHVSAERALSGPGLQNLHEALLRLDGQAPQELSPAAIAERGLRGDDPRCGEALDLFCNLMGTVAGNLALTLGALGGLYIAGGIVPKILPYFLKSGFRQRFVTKGRYQAYLEAIPVFVVVHENPTWLILPQLLRRSNPAVG